jgi:replication fork clamp-binding protein CrfC
MSKTVSPEIIRPKFGQHDAAISDLQELLSKTAGYRDIMQKLADADQKQLQERKQVLAEYDRKIESYESAIRALGGSLPQRD